MERVLRGRGNSDPYKRPNFPMEFKRRLAGQSFQPSVGRVDRPAERDQRQSAAQVAPSISPPCLWFANGATHTALISQQEPQTPLLPVTVIDDVSNPRSVPPTSAPATDGGICRVEFDHARLRISGVVSPSILRLVDSHVILEAKYSPIAILIFYLGVLAFVYP
ncbi:hypothetical protein WN982_07445 [Paraburkholderia sp. IMGN_8]|uniref:hypothetical protein n=1 Tax=Paraburkholderia sp. IMGN_8 TaxID=3136564 RepID=UPI003100B6ED